MKRHYALLSTLLLITFCQQSQSSQAVEKSLKNDFNKTQQAIGNNFTNAFMGVKVFEVVKSPLGRQNLSNCVNSIATLHPLIKEYSKNYLFMVDSSLMNAEKEIENACEKLVSYTLTIGQSISGGDYPSAQSTLQKLNSLETEVAILRKKLESKKGSYYLAAREECNRILIYAATLLEAAANKAHRDFSSSKDWLLLAQQNTGVGARNQERTKDITNYILKK
jgi:hypothetical protein